MISNRFIKFLIAGGIAALVNFGSRIVLNNWMNYVPSIVVAYVVGMITAFLLNRIFVFSAPTNSLRSQIWRFTLVNVAAVVQTVMISVVLADYLLPILGVMTNRKIIAHGIGVLVPAVSSYVGHKYFSFQNAAIDTSRDRF
jgi:putative flippase GtrA